MARLYNAETNEFIGELTDVQFQFLEDLLEEESSTDRDYYINAATIDLFAEVGAHPSFIELLRKALGDKEGIELRWEKTAP